MDFESCLSLCKVLNLEVGQCALFISKHAKMKSLKRILFVCLVLTFLTLLSCMLLRSPGRSQLLVTRMTSEKNKESSRSAQLEENRNLKHFFIFDAFAYSNGLGFLDGLSTRWEILVVNLADRGQLKSCRRCQVVKESWTQKFLAAEMSSATWKQLQGYGKEKIVAILYALLNSAEWLYVTDSQFLPDEDSLLSVCVNKTRTGPVYRGPQPVFEPCEHFMDPYTWHGLHKPGSQGLYSIKFVSNDSIHMVVDNCYKEHMDAISWRDGFDKQAPRPYTMAGTFSSVNFRNVLVSRNMAWSLVASLPKPGTQSASVPLQNVLVNLMVQRILWETSGMVGFLSSLQPTIPLNSPCCEIGSAIQKIARVYLENLSKWSCMPSYNLTQCFQQLHTDFSSYLASHSISMGSEVKVFLDTWLEIFSSHRFSTAKRVPLSASRLAEKNKGLSVQITAAKSMHTISPSASLPRNVFDSTCATEQGKKKYTAKIPPHHPITDILLVIIFNWGKHVVQIPAMELLYGRHFKHRLYCTDNMALFLEDSAKHPDTPVSFVEMDVQGGVLGHACMAAAIRLGYQVAGYLQASDDVILNPWNMYRLPRDVPWFQKSLRVATVDSTVVPDIWTDTYWGPWTMPENGHNGAVKLFDRLQVLRKAPGILGEKVSALMDNLRSVSGCDRCLMYEASDIFYVPIEIADEFAFFSDIFYPTKLHLEVAIPSILVGLVTDRGIYRLRGSYLWYADRMRYASAYSRTAHFQHPWKFTYLATPEGKAFFCQQLLPNLDKDLMSFPKATNST